MDWFSSARVNKMSGCSVTGKYFSKAGIPTFSCLLEECKLIKFKTSKRDYSFFRILRSCAGVGFSVSSALDIKEIVFVISSQENEYNSNLAEELKKEIIFQSLIVYGASPVVHLTHRDFPHFAGWTILPIATDLMELHQKNASWIFFLQDYSSVKVHKVFNMLDKYNHCEEVLVGHALYDEQTTIIHHFAFHDDPKSFKYPNLASGFAMTIALLSRISRQWEENSVYLSNFNIDVAHELAKYVWKDGCKGAVVRHESTLCSRHHYDCATYPNPIQSCDIIVPRKNIFFAVKTCEKFHRERVPIVQKTWARHAPVVKYFSETQDTSIPTINLGVPNTQSGHCGKTIAIMRYVSKITMKNDTDIRWIVIADDDTILGVTRLQQVLSCYDHTKKIAIGERYGYQIHEPFGYNYITGGGGMVFSLPLLLDLAKKCKCPSIDYPDDMFLGVCMTKMGVKVTHVPGFHQARPDDYAAGYLETHEAVSFHKHWMIDPMKVYEKWFEESDNSLLETETRLREEL
ncbi:hypothetical protein JTB14_030792 [Gonioctena quinquepunctata]|nr:hypothetical protein JTB14_030792 [Gonioctena quinquepunctata]